jgi:hypothetical protein
MLMPIDTMLWAASSGTTNFLTGLPLIPAALFNRMVDLYPPLLLELEEVIQALDQGVEAVPPRLHPMAKAY